jgi:hypothetical protein
VILPDIILVIYTIDISLLPQPSTMGDCETIYSLVPLPAMSELMVSKVVDTKRCSPKVMGEWGIFSGIMSGRNASEMVGYAENAMSYIILR